MEMDFGKQQNSKRYLQAVSAVNAKGFIRECDEVFKIAIMDLEKTNFRLDNEELKEVYKNALLYFRGDKRTKFDLGKGLYVHGSTGSGKSLLFDVFKGYTMRLKCNSFKYVKQIQIIADFGANGPKAIDKYVRDPMPVILYIDDFGTGNTSISYYGTTYNVIDELIQARYDEFVRSGALTHISSNIKPKELGNMFDKRITSRFSEMFSSIEFPNKDYRRK